MKRKKWPEEAEWARQDVIAMIRKIVLLVVVASNVTNNEPVLKILNLMVVLLNICIDWLMEAKSGAVPRELDKKFNELISLYME